MEFGVFYFDFLIEKNGTFLDIYMYGLLIVMVVCVEDI